MFCSQCGTKLPEDARFCLNCGAAVINQASDHIEVLTQEVKKSEQNQQADIPKEPVAQTEPNIPEEPAIQQVNEAPLINDETPNISEAPVNDEAPINAAPPVDEEALVIDNEANDETNDETGDDNEISTIPQPDTSNFVQEIKEYPTFKKTTDTYREINTPSDQMIHETNGNNQERAAEDKLVTPEQPLIENEPANQKASKNSKKKHLVIAACITAAVVILAAGAVIYTKITLNHLQDSIETFQALVEEKSLTGVERFQTLITDSEEIVDGYKIFQAGKMEDSLKEATTECEELSSQLNMLTEERAKYEALDQTLLLQQEDKELILQYLNEFDQAVDNGDNEEAGAVIKKLEDRKKEIITVNQESLDEQLNEYETYDNQDLTEEDTKAINQSIDQIRQAMEHNNYVQAQNQINQLGRTVASFEERIADEKEAQAIAMLYAKPESLVFMVDDTMFSQSEGRDIFEQELEQKLGIDIVFRQYTDDQYYDAVSNVFNSSMIPDVVLLREDQYYEYAAQGYLADITSYWEESKETNSYTDACIHTMDGLKIEDKLYGFTPMRRDGAVTYVRQEWLDQLGLELPTNYEEFYSMLLAFTENAMDGTKKPENTYGMTAAGYLREEMPYQMFLQEFYQDACPDFYQKADGTWADGFAEDSMVQALIRLQTAQAAGLLDPNMSTNNEEEAINQFITGKCGVISEWSGQTGDVLQKGLEANGLDSRIAVLSPIAEVGQYVTKNKMILAVTTSCEHPGGVVKYFFEPMLADEEVQMLLTFGVKGIHWDTKAEVFDYGDTYIEYGDGQLHELAYGDTSDQYYHYNLIDPLSMFASLALPYDMGRYYTAAALIGKQIINQYAAPHTGYRSNEVINSYRDEFLATRKEIVEAVMLDGEDPLTAIQEYQYYTEDAAAQILSILNQ